MNKNIQDNLSDLIDIPQAAELLLVSERTLYGWCKDKTIPSFKIGNMWRFSRKDLDTFIEQRKTVSY